MPDLPDTSRVSVNLTVVTTSDTQTFSYPLGTNASSFGRGLNHAITGTSITEMRSQMGHMTVTFGPTNITVVNLTERTFRAGNRIVLHLDIAGYDDDGDPTLPLTLPLHPIEINLGAPIASAANNIIVSQDLTALGVFSVNTTITAALAAGATTGLLDVPRNVVAAWTGTAVLTVTGLDIYGIVMRESSASGTTFAGLKAFRRITAISVSANVTGLTVGTGKVLGLPIFLNSVVDIVGQKIDGALATAGTVVAGVLTAPTALTGDVRGTCAPNSNPNGVLAFTLNAMVRSTDYRGQPQFAG